MKKIFFISFLCLICVFSYSLDAEDFVNSNWSVEAYPTDDENKKIYYFYFEENKVEVKATINGEEYIEMYNFTFIENEQQVILFQKNQNQPYFVFIQENEVWKVISPAAIMLTFGNLNLIDAVEK